MNPKDIMTDAIHNFHPQYQQYTQYSSGKFFLLFFSAFDIFRLSLNVCCLLAVAIDCLNLISFTLLFIRITLSLCFTLLFSFCFLSFADVTSTQRYEKL